jgi:hypothetical protein
MRTIKDVAELSYLNLVDGRTSISKAKHTCRLEWKD